VFCVHVFVCAYVYMRADVGVECRSVSGSVLGVWECGSVRVCMLAQEIHVRF